MDGNVFAGRPAPDTQRIDARRAMETLDYAEMGALSKMYARWALDEPRLDSDQRTLLVELSSDYEYVATYCGAFWKASKPEYPPDAIAFAARLELLDSKP